jgi:hypothetical protein
MAHGWARFLGLQLDAKIIVLSYYHIYVVVQHIYIEVLVHTTSTSTAIAHRAHHTYMNCR